MTLEHETDADTVESANEVLDSVNTGSDTDSQDLDTQDSAGDTDQNAPADDAAQQDDSDSSSTTPDTTLQTADTSAASNDWEQKLAVAEKRIADLRSGYSKKTTELDQFRKQYEGINPEVVKAFQQTQRQQEHAKLAVWDKRNPEHENFKSTLVKWETYKQSMSRAKTPEEKAVLEATVGTSFTQKDAEHIAAWEQKQKQEIAERLIDPEGYRQREIEGYRQTIREELAQAQEEMRIQAKVASWMEAPENQEKINKYRDEMIGMLHANWPWDAVRELIDARAKADGLQSRVGKSEKLSASARAQQEQLKASASSTMTRDPAVKQIAKQDYWKEAKKWAVKQGLPQDHPRVNKYLNDLVMRSNPQ